MPLRIENDEDFLSALHQTLRKLYKFRFLYRESEELYARKHMRLFVPSIAITGISGFVSFLASSAFISSAGARTNNALTITVGVLTSVSTMIQSFASVVDYQTKATMFREAAQETDTLITVVESEILHSNENRAQFLDMVEAKIIDIRERCKFFAPRDIVDGYEKRQLKRDNATIAITTTTPPIAATTTGDPADLSPLLEPDVVV